MMKANMTGGAEIQVLSLGKQFPQGRFERVQSRFERVINFHWEDRIISLCDESVLPAPLRIIVGNLRIEQVKSVRRIDECTIWIEKERFELTPQQIYDPAVVFKSGAWKTIVAKVGELTKIYNTVCRGKGLQYLLGGQSDPASAGPLEKALRRRFREGYEACLAGNFKAAISCLRGLGGGLTPAGDDFLAGLQTGLGLAEQTAKLDLAETRQFIYSYSFSQSPIVNTLRYQSYNALYPQEWRDLVTTLVSNGDLRASVKAIVATGETSGSDMLAGFITGLAFAAKA